MPFDNLLNISVKSFDNLLHISVQKDWVDYFSALLTPMVAVFGICIAYRQWRTDEAKLRHELFERRYKQFDAVINFVYAVRSFNLGLDSTYPTYKEEDNLLLAITGMNFIFSEEIENIAVNNMIVIYRQIQDLRVNYYWTNNSKKQQKNETRQNELKNDLQKKLQTFQEKTLKYLQIQ